MQGIVFQNQFMSEAFILHVLIQMKEKKMQKKSFTYDVTFFTLLQRTILSLVNSAMEV